MQITLTLPTGYKDQKPDSKYPKGFYFKYEEDSNGKPIQESHKITMSADQFSEYVTKVMTHSFVSWRGSQKVATAIDEHYAITLDIDDGLTINDFKQIDDFKPLRYYIYTSKSHQIAKKDQSARDRFHVVFPFSEPIDHDNFMKLLDSLATVTQGIGVGNDHIHDNNENSIFFPSRFSGEKVSEHYKFIKNENNTTDITQEFVDNMIEQNGFVKEIRTRKSNGDRPPFNKDLVEDFEAEDVLKASVKIGKMAKEEGWDYKKIVDIGFAIADMEHKQLIDRETAITALFNCAGGKVTKEMVANKYESSLFNSGHSITLSSYLKAAQDAGYKKHIISYATSLKAGNDFLNKNLKTVMEVIKETQEDNTNSANFIQEKVAKYRKTLGSQFMFNGGKLYQIAIEYNRETGSYWMHNHKNLPPTPVKSLVTSLSKKIEISKEMIPSIEQAFGSFIVSVFPHIANLDSISAEYDSDFNKLWKSENNTPEVSRGASAYNCRNCFKEWSGTDKQDDADKIYDMISRIFDNEANRDFYLKWLTLFTFVDKIGTTPVMIFTSKNRGTGKSMLLTDLPDRIFRSSVVTEFKHGSFNHYVQSKLVSLSEVGSGSGATYNEAARIIKKTTGSKLVLLNNKNEKARMVPSRSFFTIDSNEETPIRLFDRTGEGNNQFFVVRLGQSLTDKYQDWVSKTLKETVFSGRYDEMIAAFRELYLEPLIPVIRAEKGERFGLKVPITEDLEALLGKSISIKDKAAILALNDLNQSDVDYDCIKIKDSSETLRYVLSHDALKAHKTALRKGFLSNQLSTSYFKVIDKTSKDDMLKRLRNLEILTEASRKNVNKKTARGWVCDIKKLEEFVKMINPSLLS